MMIDQNDQIARQRAAKMPVPANPSVPDMSDVVYALRPEARDMTPPIKLDVLLGVYMVATQPEFKDNGDPRPGLVPDETVRHIRKMLENCGVQVDASIDRALNRTGATA